ANSDEGWKNAKSIYEFTALDIDGNKVDFNKYRYGIMFIHNLDIVVVSYNLGYEVHIEKSNKQLYFNALLIESHIGSSGGNQVNPWAEPEIKEFVKKQFNVTFDMFSKISVNGDNAHPLWKYLKERQPGFLFNAIKWNFTKFLVDKNGQPVKRYGPTDSFEASYISQPCMDEF
ncbi:phospholipid-hydroperoxide glutathione peroxidase, putative, partial [Ixodes scapularis]